MEEGMLSWDFMYMACRDLPVKRFLWAMHVFRRLRKV